MSKFDRKIVPSQPEQVDWLAHMSEWTSTTSKVSILVSKLRATRRVAPDTLAAALQLLATFKEKQANITTLNADDVRVAKKAETELTHHLQMIENDPNIEYDSELQIFIEQIKQVENRILESGIFYETAWVKSQKDAINNITSPATSTDCNTAEKFLQALSSSLQNIESSLVNNTFPSEHLRRTHAQLDAFAFDVYTGDRIKAKRDLTELVARDDIFDKDILQMPSVYIGSYTDIEFPLLLGARDIRLVDPALADEDVRSELRSRITAITGLPPSELSLNSWQCSMDMGSGAEPITIAIEPLKYGASESDQTYQPPEKIGMIIAFKSGDVRISNDQRTLNALDEHGYIVSTKDAIQPEIGAEPLPLTTLASYAADHNSVSIYQSAEK